MAFLMSTDLAFAVGAQRMGGALTELYILDRTLVEARDPAGLIPIDASRALGLPHKMRATPSGMGAYMGTAEQARTALTEAGLMEAPMAVLPESDTPLAYVDRFGNDGQGGIRPQERLVHEWREGRLFIIGRFPGEADRLLGHRDLPDTLRPHLPAFEGADGVALAQDPALVSAWLEQVASIAQTAP